MSPILGGLLGILAGVAVVIPVATIVTRRWYR